MIALQGANGAEEKMKSKGKKKKEKKLSAPSPIAVEDEEKESVNGNDLVQELEQVEIDHHSPHTVLTLPTHDKDEGESKMLESERNELRSQLEEQGNKEHSKTIASLTQEKSQLELQYRNLLGKVGQIRSTLGERLKQDAHELAESKNTIDDLEEQNQSLREAVGQLQEGLVAANDESKSISHQFSALQSTLMASQQSWNKERERLVFAERAMRDDLDATTRALRDWEMVASEERAEREGLAMRIAELEGQLSHQRLAAETASQNHSSSQATISRLQQALADLQEARESELRQVVDSMQAQIDALSENASLLESKSLAAEKANDEARHELERARPFEKEVKEKNLLIGKLRHEAVILNEHLTKALRVLKRGAQEETVDKTLVNNLIISFLNLPRNDTKRFEVLQLMSSVLAWTDEQREIAGIMRPGSASSGSPLYPHLRRNPSTPSLNSIDYFADRGESLGGLFQEFLEKEAIGDKTRKNSASS